MSRDNNDMKDKRIKGDKFGNMFLNFLISWLMAHKNGNTTSFKTMMATAHDLLLNTVFY